MEQTSQYTSVQTFTATIYVGAFSRDAGIIYSLDIIKGLCQEYVNRVGLCVTVTPTDFIYTNGYEPGAVIGLINYPRFPMLSDVIKKHALVLGELLLYKLDQYVVSIVMPDETVMLTNKYKINEQY
jgi:hypothetical protein